MVSFVVISIVSTKYSLSYSSFNNMYIYICLLLGLPAIWEDFIHSNNQVTRMMVYKGAIIKAVVLLMWNLQQFAQYSNRGEWGPCVFYLHHDGPLMVLRYGLYELARVLGRSIQKVTSKWGYKPPRHTLR